MSDKTKAILEKISFQKEWMEYLNNAEYNKAIFSKNRDKVYIEFNNPEALDINVYIKLHDTLEKYFKIEVSLGINTEKKSYKRAEEYFNYFVENPKFKNLKGKLVQGLGCYYISFNNENEKDRLNEQAKAIIKILDLVGINTIEILVDESKRKEIQDEISKDLDIKVKETTVVHEEVKSNNPYEKFHKKNKIKDSEEAECIMGEKIIDDPIKINDIDGEKENITIIGEVFNVNEDEDYRSGVSKKSGKEYFMITLRLTDYSNSIYAKVFARSAEEFDRFKKLFVNGSCFLFKGSTKINDYSKILEFSVQSINLYSQPTKEKRKDNSLVKRAELHCHTKQSQMDGVADEVKLVKQAIEWGMPGIAITDHDGCQSFPHVFKEVTDYNKKIKKNQKTKIEEIENKIKDYQENDVKYKVESLIKEEGKNPKYEEALLKFNNGDPSIASMITKGRDDFPTYEQELKDLNENLKEEKEKLNKLEYFKVGYGTELNMCESYLNVCFNPKDIQINDSEFIVFDTETTGFNAGLGDSMIEIGGVRVKGGIVLDRFDELINPGHPIDKEITDLTDISDEDVKDCDNEELVVKRFKEWIKDTPLVAHNARFDKSMLDMAYFKYDLGKLENPIIDTLMLSRVINRDLKKHSLKALGKKYGISTGEKDDDDEEEVTTQKSKNLPISKFASIRIRDILVNGNSIKLGDSNEMFTKICRLKAKSEEALVSVLYDENEVYEQNYSLHAAENIIEIEINSAIKFNINIYVGNHHGADVDSENTALIFNKMLKQIEGIKNINELNNLKLLEETAFNNNDDLRKKIGELVSYKNYIRLVEEDEEVDPKFGYPFEKYNNKDYVWRFEWCHDDYLQMYENIPSKTFSEHLANQYDRFKHVTMIAKNKTGLKNLFKIISYANSNFLQTNATIPRKIIDEYREGVLIGSACLNGEIFDIACTKNDNELINAMKWYDYIEVQPIDNYIHLLRRHDINYREQIEELIKKIIRCAKQANKLIIATGDVHQIDKEDLLYREIIVNQNVPGKGKHSLAKYLQSDSKENTENLETINNIIKDCNFNYIEGKVLKYIYALTNIETIPITLNNISEIYHVEKDNKEEEIFKSKENSKESIIQSALNNLMNYNIISSSVKNYGMNLNRDFAQFIKTDISNPGHIPNQYFRTTDEMKEAFNFLKDKVLIDEIVVKNSRKLLDGIEEIEVVVYPDKPFSPEIAHSQETCRDLVFTKAHSMYGDPLPRNIEERIAQEFYGDKIGDLVKNNIREEHPDYDDNKIEEIYSSELHKVIMSGYGGVVNLKKKEVKKNNPDLNDPELTEQAKAELTGIIGGGFDVIYLIAQKLVKHSNDDGYLVGSRGSVGSSFVASMMGITECNGLPPHYYCPKCQYSMFKDEEGNQFHYTDKNTGEEEIYLSGFDLPERDCPKCGAKMIHQGNDMPFATFLGFAGEKVPDIDLNFSGDNQADAHEYTKVLFGTDNVYRAGTISTVADKIAYGFALGFFEEEEYNKLKAEVNSYGLSLATKDALKKAKIIKSLKNDLDVERIALGCVDVKRTTGQHPGGIVVVPGYKDVWDFTPFQYPADDPTVPWRTTHFDYHAIDADLLKLDILGHDDPTVLRILQDMTGIDVTSIDLGDKDTMRIFTGPEVLGINRYDLRGLTDKEGNKYCPTGTLGVPEFGTSFLLGMLEETKPTTFAELIKISGLSHGTDVWLGNARDLCTPNEEGIIRVPFKNVIGCRDDIMVNLMQWGMKPSKAFKIMEFVRKGKPSKDPLGWKDHVKTMQEAGIPDWYIESCSKIKYMFPKAHATAYVTSAFRIAWFKVHMPIYYYAAYFSIRCDQFEIQTMVLGERAIRTRIDELEEKKDLHETTPKEESILDVLYVCLEMTLRGLHFENVNIQKSDAKYFKVTEDKKGLIIPFVAIDGLGASATKVFMKERAKAPFRSLEELQQRGKISKSIIDKLKAMHVLDGLPESDQLSLFDNIF